jgi:hypothetical protein
MTTETKDQELVQKPKTLTIAGVNVEYSPDALEALREAGIDPTKVDAPEPEGAVVARIEDLCVLPTTHPNADKESPVLILTALDVNEDSKEFDNYEGFIVAHVIHPLYGAIKVTHGYVRIESDGVKTKLPLTDHLISNGHPGMAFKAGLFKTRAGFKVIRPIPVQ